MKNINPSRIIGPVLIALLLLLGMNSHAQHSQLPAAIVGQAGELKGKTLNYYQDAQGYLALPSGEGPHGAVILIHEWNGVVDRIKEMADSFAQEGYVALAADLYKGRTGANRQENVALMREASADPEEIVANLNAAVKFLRAREDTNDKIATIGWCFGGGIALSYALGGEHHEGTAIFYGRLITDPEQLKNLDHEIYGTFAGQDRGIPVSQVNEFVETLRKVGIPNDVHIYDPVGHGFWLYVERDAEARTDPALHAWDRLQNYLKRTIGE